MSDESKRAQIKKILNELSDNAAPVMELTVQALEEDWDEEKTRLEMAKVLKNTDLTKTFDYYTDRIMTVFKEDK